MAGSYVGLAAVITDRGERKLGRAGSNGGGGVGGRSFDRLKLLLMGGQKLWWPQGKLL